MKQMILLIVLACFTLGCTDASRAKIGGYGEEYKVELINCEGMVVRVWVSSGKVQSETNSIGYYFNDKKTGKLVEVSGTIIITAL